MPRDRSHAASPWSASGGPLAGVASGLLLATAAAGLLPGAPGPLPLQPLHLAIWLVGLAAGCSGRGGRHSRQAARLLAATGPLLAWLLLPMALRLPTFGAAALGLEVLIALVAMAPAGWLGGTLMAGGADGGLFALGLAVAAVAAAALPGPWLLAAACVAAPLAAVAGLAAGPAAPATRDRTHSLASGVAAATLTLALAGWTQAVLLVAGGTPVLRLQLLAAMAIGIAGAGLLSRALPVTRIRAWEPAALLAASTILFIALMALTPWLLRSGIGWTGGVGTTLLSILGLVIPMLLCGLGRALDPRPALSAMALGAAVGWLLAAWGLSPALGPDRLLMLGALALPLTLTLPAVLLGPWPGAGAMRTLAAMALAALSLAVLGLPAPDGETLSAGLGWRPGLFLFQGRPALPDALGRHRLLAASSRPSGLVSLHVTSGQPPDLAWQGWPLGPQSATSSDIAAAAIPGLLSPAGGAAVVAGDRAGRLGAALARLRPDLQVTSLDVVPGLRNVLQPDAGGLQPAAEKASAWAGTGPYAVILLQPLPARIAGSGAAWSLEALTGARRALAEEGLAALRLRPSELGVRDLAQVVSGWLQAFPAASLWYDGDQVLLLGASRPPLLALASFEQRFRSASAALADTGMQRPADLMARFILPRQALSSLAADIRPERLRWPHLAFQPWPAAGDSALSMLSRMPSLAQDEHGLQVLDIFGGLPEAARAELESELAPASLAAARLLAMSGARAQAEAGVREVSYATALALGGQALELRPEDADVRRAVGATALAAAHAALLAGEDRDALALAERAVELDPTQVDHHLALYHLTVRLRTPGAAQRRLAAAATLFPDSYPLLLAQARRRLDQGDVHAADTFLRRAAATGFETAELRLGWARVDFLRGRTAEGQRMVAAAVDLGPDPALLLADIGGSLLESEPALAELYLQRALDMGRRRVDVLAPLGQLALVRGEHERAIRWLEEAVADDPGQARPQLDLGSALLLAGRADEAIPHLQAALAHAPDDPMARLNLAAAMARQGRREEAARYLEGLEEALGSNPVYLRLRSDLQP